MTKSRFDIEYNKWLQQVDVDKEDSVWNEVQDELDFNETWDNISARLDEIKPQRGLLIPMSFLRKTAVAAAILLLLFLPVRDLVYQTDDSTIISEVSKEPVEKEKISPAEMSPFIVQQNEGEDEKKTQVEQLTEADDPPENLFFEESLAPSAFTDLTGIVVREASEDSDFIDNGLAFERIPNPSFNIKDHLISMDDIILPNVIDAEPGYFSEPDESPALLASKPVFKIVDVGLVYGYKNTWLLNYETRNGLDPTRLGGVQPTFRQDIGVSTSFELYSRHQFGLEFFWKSESGQNYQQYMNASYVDKDISLDYLKLQAFYCWKNKIIPGQVIMGGYAARLTMAEEQINETIYSVNDRYNDFDYGLLAGYQVDVPLAKRIIIKPGVRFNYNLVNIFEGDKVIPGKFRDTRNLAASFNISFSYRFN